jgi:O-antigen/teichoic acid export membrane protein
MATVRSERRLAAIAGSVVGSSLVTSALGLVFWMLAARGLTPAPLGSLGAATAAMSFIGVLGSVGLGPLLISELPRTPADRQWELFSVGGLVAAVAGAVLGGGFAAIAALTGHAWAPLHAPGAAWWWFVLGAALTSISTVLDNAMLVVGNPTMQVWRNTVASTWKVVLLGIALALSAVQVSLGLAAWATGLLAGALMAGRAAARRMPGRRLVPVGRALGLIRRHALSAISHQGVNLALAASSVAMPVVIAWVVSPVENGVFTAVRLAAAQACLLPFALSMALFAASAGDKGFDAERSRRVLLAALGISLLLYLIMFVFAHLVLLLFGRAYADQGVPYLRVMALAAPLLVFKDQYIALSRVRRQVRSLVPLVAVSAVLELSLSVSGALRWHLMGAICGWLIALAIQAVYVTPRLTWRTGPSDDLAAPALDGAGAADVAGSSASISPAPGERSEVRSQPAD